MGYILDPHKEILMTMNKNLGIIIQKYGNKHTVQNFKGRTPHIENEQQGSSSARGSKDTTPQSNRSKRKNGEPGDFSAAMNDLSDKKDLK